MKLNQTVLLGFTSFLIGVAPVSFAVAGQASSTVTQAPIVSNTIVSNTIVGNTTLAQAAAIASGTFVAGEAPTTGTARIVTEGGHRYLELDAAFSTSNMGPDLHVLLDSAASPPQSYANLGSAVNLGKLHSSSGAQRYPIPDAIDLAKFKTAVIWCRMANATFGYAPLN
jgi:hypothetical protein